MNYIVKQNAGVPRFDNIGVIKLLCNIDVPINERIYAQAQVGRNEEVLYMRILSFETAPTPLATLKAQFVNAGNTLTLFITADGTAKGFINGDDCTDSITAYLINGEDLQGEYWGAVIMISLEDFMKKLAINTLSEQEISGNIMRENPFVSSAALTENDVKFIFK